MSKTRIVSADENSATIVMGSNGLEDLALALNKLKNKYSIKKAKLADIALNVEYSETLEDSSNKVSKDCTAPVHEDLKTAFSNMNGLLRDITEQPEESDVQCTGFTIGKNEDGAVLIGFRSLDSGSALNLTSPFVRFEDNGSLEHAVSVAKQEALLYLFEKKHAPDAQLSLFENQSGEEF